MVWNFPYGMELRVLVLSPNAAVANGSKYRCCELATNEYIYIRCWLTTFYPAPPKFHYAYILLRSINTYKLCFCNQEILFGQWRRLRAIAASLSLHSHRRTHRYRATSLPPNWFILAVWFGCGFFTTLRCYLTQRENVV